MSHSTVIFGLGDLKYTMDYNIPFCIVAGVFFLIEVFICITRVIQVKKFQLIIGSCLY